MGVWYWSIVVVFLGSCIGSFLNVVIFRWPRGLSTHQPARSFCPACSASIAWYDNIPILSYVLLRARCRHCRAPISLQYPLVEAATALVFLMTYDAFFVARERAGIGNAAADWPMLLAHWALWGGLLALSVMDLEAYVVDIRVTWIVSAVGILAHAVWTPVSSTAPGTWIRPGPLLAPVCLAAAIGLGIGALLFLRRLPPAVEDEAAEQSPEEPITGRSVSTTRWPWMLVAVVILVGYLALMVAMPKDVSAPNEPALSEARDVVGLAVPVTTGTLRLAGGLACAFIGLALVAAIPHAEADTEIVESIESEAVSARREAGRELLLISPAILLGILALALSMANPSVGRVVREQLLPWNPAGEWKPLLGLSTGVAGWLIGGAVGWLARISFTLVLGKEALGMGDVHILAAAGAVAGWPVALLGFFLAAPLTLLAMIVIHVRRQSRALPYGPWLALGFFVASAFQDRILHYLGFRQML